LAEYKGMPSDYETTKEAVQMPERKIIEQLTDSLHQELMHIEKAIASLTDRLVGVLGDGYPVNTDPQDIKYPGGESPLAKQLQEFCLRAEAMGDSINRLRDRIEL
jgi:hypothetical protein